MKWLAPTFLSFFLFGISGPFFAKTVKSAGVTTALLLYGMTIVLIAGTIMLFGPLANRQLPKLNVAIAIVCGAVFATLAIYYQFVAFQTPGSNPALILIISSLNPTLAMIYFLHQDRTWPEPHQWLGYGILALGLSLVLWRKSS